MKEPDCSAASGYVCCLLFHVGDLFPVTSVRAGAGEGEGAARPCRVGKIRLSANTAIFSPVPCATPSAVPGTSQALGPHVSLECSYLIRFGVYQHGCLVPDFFIPPCQFSPLHFFFVHVYLFSLLRSYCRLVVLAEGKEINAHDHSTV